MGAEADKTECVAPSKEDQMNETMFLIYMGQSSEGVEYKRVVYGVTKLLRDSGGFI